MSELQQDDNEPSSKAEPLSGSEPLFIAPHSKRNGISLTIAGSIALFISLIIFISAKSLFGVGMVLFGFGSVGLVLGVAKLKQPKASFKLSAHGFDYYHGRGTVHVAWDNIQRIDVSRVTQNLALIELPYIGIKLNKINPILDCISPRLATGLLTEQRPLLMTAATQDEDLQSLETYVGAEFTPLVVNNERYRGVLAMFGHRCQTLEAQLGFHLYLSVDSLDRTPEEFVSLLREWKMKSV